MHPMIEAPKDGKPILLRTPDTDIGWTVAFWSDPSVGDATLEESGWYQSDSHSNPIWSEPIGWLPLPNGDKGFTSSSDERCMVNTFKDASHHVCVPCDDAFFLTSCREAVIMDNYSLNFYFEGKQVFSLPVCCECQKAIFPDEQSTMVGASFDKDGELTSPGRLYHSKCSTTQFQNSKQS